MRLWPEPHGSWPCTSSTSCAISDPERCTYLSPSSILSQNPRFQDIDGAWLQFLVRGRQAHEATHTTIERVDIQAPADLSACTDLYIIMAEPGGAGYHVQGPSNKIQMWIVDVEGQPTVFQIESFAGTPPEDLAAAQQIMDSIEIRP